MSLRAQTVAHQTEKYVWDENLETSKNPNITGEWSDVKIKRMILSKKFQTTENFIRMLDWGRREQIL